MDAILLEKGKLMGARISVPFFQRFIQKGQGVA